MIYNFAVNSVIAGPVPKANGQTQTVRGYALPEGDVHGPADKPYRQRELLVLAPDGNLIAFGQAIAGAAG